jgi:hypothetical protein
MGFFLATTLFISTLTTATASAKSPWNGTRVRDVARSTPGIKDGAAESYRFTLRSDGQIKWEILSLGEVVTGKTDGMPMEIHRTEPSLGQTLSVMTDGPEVLIYEVARNGKPVGEGRMTLVENGKAWVDISWPEGKPQNAGEVVYVKQ